MVHESFETFNFLMIEDKQNMHAQPFASAKHECPHLNVNFLFCFLTYYIKNGLLVLMKSKTFSVGPGSMPCQLMMGFFAYAKTFDIHVDKSELQGNYNQ